MKIEAGKYYKLRNGEKIYVMGRAPKTFLCTYPFITCSKDDVFCVDSYGRYVNSVVPHERDIIADWDEPKEVKLPEKFSALARYATGLTLEQKAVNQLIDYCKALEQRLTILEGK